MSTNIKVQVIENNGGSYKNNNQTDYSNQCFWISLLDYQFITESKESNIKENDIQNNRTKENIKKIKEEAYGKTNFDNFNEETQIETTEMIGYIIKIAKEKLKKPIRIIYYNKEDINKPLLLGLLNNKETLKEFRTLDFFDPKVITDEKVCIYIVAYGNHFELITKIDTPNFKYEITNYSKIDEKQNIIDGGRYYNSNEKPSDKDKKSKKRINKFFNDKIKKFKDITDQNQQKKLTNNEIFIKNKFLNDVLDKSVKEINLFSIIGKINNIINQKIKDIKSNKYKTADLIRELTNEYEKKNKQLTSLIYKKNEKHTLNFIKQYLIEGDIARMLFFHNKFYIHDIHLLKYIRDITNTPDIKYKKAAVISFNDLVKLLNYNIISTIRNGCFNLEGMYQNLLTTQFKSMKSINNYYNNHMIMEKNNIDNYNFNITYDNYGVGDFTLDEYDIIKKKYNIIDGKSLNNKVKLINNKKRIVPCLANINVQENINVYQSNTIFTLGYVDNTCSGTIKLPRVNDKLKTCYLEFLCINKTKNIISQPLYILLPDDSSFKIVINNNKTVDVPLGGYKKKYIRKIMINNLEYYDKIKCYYDKNEWCILINSKRTFLKNSTFNKVSYVIDKTYNSDLLLTEAITAKIKDETLKIPRNILGIKTHNVYTTTNINMYSLARYGFFPNELFNNYSTTYNMFYYQPKNETRNKSLGENIHIYIPYNKKNIKGITYKFTFNKMKNRLNNNIKIYFHIKKLNSGEQNMLFYNYKLHSNDTKKIINEEDFIIELSIKDIINNECIEFKCIGDTDKEKEKNINIKEIDVTDYDDPLNYNLTKWYIYIKNNELNEMKSAFEIIKKDNYNDDKIKLTSNKLITEYNNSRLSFYKFYNKCFLDNQMDIQLKQNLEFHSKYSSIYYINSSINNNILKLDKNSLLILDDENLNNGIKFKLLFTKKNVICYIFNYLDYDIYYKNNKINELYFNITNNNIISKILNVSYLEIQNKKMLLIY